MTTYNVTIASPVIVGYTIEADSPEAACAVAQELTVEWAKALRSYEFAAEPKPLSQDEYNAHIMAAHAAPLGPDGDES